MKVPQGAEAILADAVKTRLLAALASRTALASQAVLASRAVLASPSVLANRAVTSGASSVDYETFHHCVALPPTGPQSAEDRRKHPTRRRESLIQADL